MKRDSYILIVAMIFNFLIAIIKLVSGIIFNFSSLIADSLQSLFDFITDIISTIASRIGDKRANKKHPFGYGMIENISNLFVGIILFLLALFILVRGFMVESSDVNNIVFLVLIITLLLKGFVVSLLYFNGKKLKNNFLLMSSKESFTDLLATFIVLVVSILLLFKDKVYLFRYADIFGSVIISFIIFKTAFNIIKVNIDYLLGSTEVDDNINLKINNIIEDEKLIMDSKIKLLKIGDYYTLYLTIELDDNVTLRRILLLENRIKKKIKNSVKVIKYIQIELKEFK